MKIKATAKFKELGIDNSYQGLRTEDYLALRRNEIVDIDNIPKHLIVGEYIKEIKIREK